jgi:hypothetical protein
MNPPFFLGAVTRNPPPCPRGPLLRTPAMRPYRIKQALPISLKPAVISVRVKIDESAKMMSMDQNDENDMIPFVPGSPMEKFFQQFGFPDMPKMLKRQEIITAKVRVSSSHPTVTRRCTSIVWLDLGSHRS